YHHGTAAEKAALERLRSGEPPRGGVVEALFRESARVVLERAYEEGRASFRALAGLGHWFEPELADQVVQAIVGLDGVARMEALTEGR
ncbi:MAG: hypothetical protein Q8N53_11260, partial [Longimicrobiales bacterium]|nr:hypothetical protein [Longimicrobiales bacterium]